MNEFIQHLKEKIKRPLPGIEAQLKMAPITRPNHLPTPPNAKLSAVMILLFKKNDEWNTILIQRTMDGHAHSGQISFPGGKKDEGDESIVYTAFRECEEEIGIQKNSIELIGQLTSIYIPPSNFHVTPILGFIDEIFEIKPSIGEVDEVIFVPLKKLFDINIKKESEVKMHTGTLIKSNAYVLPNHKIIWGATAMIISELEHFLANENL